MFYGVAEKRSSFLGHWNRRELAFDTKRRHLYYGERVPYSASTASNRRPSVSQSQRRSNRVATTQDVPQPPSPEQRIDQVATPGGSVTEVSESGNSTASTPVLQSPAYPPATRPPSRTTPTTSSAFTAAARDGEPSSSLSLRSPSHSPSQTPLPQQQQHLQSPSHEKGADGKHGRGMEGAVVWKRKMKVNRLVLAASAYGYSTMDPLLNERDFYALEVHGDSRDVGNGPPLDEPTLVQLAVNGRNVEVTEGDLYQALRDQFSLLKLEKERLQDLRLQQQQQRDGDGSGAALSPSLPSTPVNSSSHRFGHRGFWSRLGFSSSSRLGSMDNVPGVATGASQQQLHMDPRRETPGNSPGRGRRNSVLSTPQAGPSAELTPFTRSHQESSDNVEALGSGQWLHNPTQPLQLPRSPMAPAPSSPPMWPSQDQHRQPQSPTANGANPSEVRSGSAGGSARTQWESTGEVQTLVSPKQERRKATRKMWFFRFYCEKDFRRFKFLFQSVLGYDRLRNRPNEGLPPYDPRNGIPFGTVPPPLWSSFRYMEDTVFYTFQHGDLVGTDDNNCLCVSLPHCYLCITYDMVFVARSVGTIPRWTLLRDVAEVHYNTTASRPFISFLTDGVAPDIVFIPAAPEFDSEGTDVFSATDAVLTLKNVVEQTCFETMGVRRVIKTVERNDVPAVRAYCTVQARARAFKWTPQAGFQGTLTVPVRKEKLAQLWREVLQERRRLQASANSGLAAVSGITIEVEEANTRARASNSSHGSGSDWSAASPQPHNEQRQQLTAVEASTSTQTDELSPSRTLESGAPSRVGAECPHRRHIHGGADWERIHITPTVGAAGEPALAYSISSPHDAGSTRGSHPIPCSPPSCEEFERSHSPSLAAYIPRREGECIVLYKSPRTFSDSVDDHRSALCRTHTHSPRSIFGTTAPGVEAKEEGIVATSAPMAASVSNGEDPARSYTTNFSVEVPVAAFFASPVMPSHARTGMGCGDGGRGGGEM